MKKFKIVLILLLLIILDSFAQDGSVNTPNSGELIFRPKAYNQTIEVTLELLSEYGWLPNPNGGYFVYDDHLISSNKTVGFDSPTSMDGDGFVTWGKYLVNFSCGIYEYSFTIDLRDEDWTNNTQKYPSCADTYFTFDSEYNKIEIGLRLESNIVQTIDVVKSPSLDLNIWELWNAGAPVQNNFVPEVQLSVKNEVENTNHHFGFLKANNKIIPTDSFEKG